MQHVSHVVPSLPSNAMTECLMSEISSGLLSPNPMISSKYFYDLKGSELFESITQLEAYYLTRTERGILIEVQEKLEELIGRGVTLVDLGAGNCSKAESLFESLKPSHYVAVDIASEFLTGVLKRLRQSYPEIQIDQVDLDFSEGLGSLPPLIRGPKLFFYPGSSIGNFSPDRAASFLRSIRDAASPGDSLLLGIDLVKEKEVLEAAYNDPAGITRLFNLNILEHINRLAFADFDTRYWDHMAYYNDEDMRIEMHLISTQDQTVRWLGGERSFSKGATILTEYSHKYLLDEFEGLLDASGFHSIKHWTDDSQWFALILAQVR